MKMKKALSKKELGFNSTNVKIFFDGLPSTICTTPFSSVNNFSSFETAFFSEQTVQKKEE